MPRERHPVRLGKHQDDYVFDANRGLHDPVTGVAVVGMAPDPEIIFEEHGLGITCQYLELRGDVELNEALGPRDVLEPKHRQQLAERVNSTDPPTQLQAVQSAFALENPEIVNAMLRSLAADLTKHDGGIWVVRASWRLQRRMAMVRVLHSAQAQPGRSFAQLVSEPHPLQDHAAGSDTVVTHFFQPVALLGSPFVLGAVGARAVPEASETYVLLAWFGRDRGFSVVDDVVRWDQVFDVSPMFRASRLSGDRPASIHWQKELGAGAALLPAAELLDWWTACLNEMLTEATDLGRYRLGDGLFDARNAYRELRTLDRIFVNCVRIQTAGRDHMSRINGAVDFFDLLPGLLDVSVRPRALWEAMLNPDRAVRILDGAFSRAPSTIRDYLSLRAHEVARVLREEALAAVVPGRLVDGRPQVGDPPSPMDPGEYVSRLYQALRDTHHGYELDTQWKRDILDSHSGHMSEAFPELVILYVLALAADTDRAISGGWFAP